MFFFSSAATQKIILKKKVNFSNYFATLFLPAIAKIKNMSEIKHPRGSTLCAVPTRGPFYTFFSGPLLVVAALPTPRHAF